MYSPSSSTHSSSSPPSLLTSPSVSSTFSDISLLSISSIQNPISKTSAFFATPFSTRPPSPDFPSSDSVPAQDTHAIPVFLHRLFPSKYHSHNRSHNDLDLTDFRKQTFRPDDDPTDPDSTPRPPPLVPSIRAPPPLADSDPPPALKPGFTISSHSSTAITTLTLVRALGQGAFSSVWLARDVSDPPLSPHAARIDPHPIGSYIPGTTPMIPPDDNNHHHARRPPPSSEPELGSPPPSPRLVAVKITPRDRDRDRVGFIREVEVLRHISHPNITSLLGALTTPTHHALVLPHRAGGDLLSLVNTDSTWSTLTESTLRRLWSELCSAVSWMHTVGLVHRDIKLENILLLAPPTQPHPLIQLSDFGLARFLDPRSPLTRTRCGSEAYAAPELITAGRPSDRHDPRATDAWACGVVLFAVCVRRLPFGDGSSVSTEGRRRWLVRIARGEYVWPESDGPNSRIHAAEEELMGESLVRSRGARRIVSRLLVRDPARRASIGDHLWSTEEWMWGAPVKGVLVPVSSY